MVRAVRQWFFVGMLSFLLIAPLGTWAAPAQPVTEVTENQLWAGPSQGLDPSDSLVQLMKNDPSIRIKEWAGLTLPGAGGRTPLMLSIAGQTAPDLYLSWFHIIRGDIGQGFCAPLNEWIGDDLNHDGQIEPSEARWPGWKEVPPLWRQVATVNGKVYGIPTASTVHMGIIYRIDLVRQAGLDPNHPPKTWDEFLYWCQKLTYPGKKVPGAQLQRGQRGFACMNYGFTWLPWLQSTGGTPVKQIKVSPTTGKRYEFPMEATECRAPDTGEDLSNVPSNWSAAFASDAGQRAMGFYHRLRWQRWIRDTRSGDPVNLTDAQVAAGKVTMSDGRIITFKPDDVITGAIRPLTGSPDDDWGGWIGRGEVAMTQWFFDDLSTSPASAGVNPDLLGVFPIPAGPGGQPVVQVQRHYVVMSEGVQRRPKRERDAIWKVMTTLNSSQTYDENVRRQVLSGHARFVDPNDLARLGFKDYIPEVPPSLRQLYAGLDSHRVLARTEPFMGFWYTMDSALNMNVINMVFSDSGEHFDYVRGLHEVEDTANTGTMFARSSKQLSPIAPSPGRSSRWWRCWCSASSG